MEEIAQKSYDVPWQEERYKVSSPKLWRWLTQYRKHGFFGLIPRVRSDKATSKAIDLILSERIIGIKKADPEISIPLLISSLEDSNETPKGKLKHSTVHRLLQQHGLSGRPGKDRGHKTQRLPYKYEFPMDLWVGDVMHSRHLIHDRKVYLMAWIDNATRAIMHAEYGYSEGALSLLSSLSQAIKVLGICKRIYVDHGSGYVDGRFVRTCAHLGIHLMYAPVRDGAAKGCIERWFSGLRSSFEPYLKTSDLETLETLNSMLWRWIDSTYHTREHAALEGKSPWQCFMEKLPLIDHRRIDSQFDFIALWRTRETRTVRRDGTVSLNGHQLEIPPTVSRNQVELRFMEEDLPNGVEIWEADRYLGIATPVNREANTHRRRWRPRSSETTGKP